MNDYIPVWVMSNPSTDAEVIGHCKVCGKTHSGPFMIGLVSKPDGDIIVAVLVADENQEHHIVEAASLAALTEAFSVKWAQYNPNPPAEPGGSSESA